MFFDDFGTKILHNRPDICDDNVVHRKYFFDVSMRIHEQYISLLDVCVWQISSVAKNPLIAQVPLVVFIAIFVAIWGPSTVNREPPLATRPREKLDLDETASCVMLLLPKVNRGAVYRVALWGLSVASEN